MLQGLALAWVTEDKRLKERPWLRVILRLHAFAPARAPIVRRRSIRPTIAASNKVQLGWALDYFKVYHRQWSVGDENWWRTWSVIGSKWQVSISTPHDSVITPR